jgi:predicted TIM-barrel fold metal-dependent hydrolase
MAHPRGYSLRFVDFHLHLPSKGFLRTLRPLMRTLGSYFKAEVRERDPKEVLEELRSQGLERAVVLPIDASPITGLRGDTNEFMARVQALDEDALYCLATIRPGAASEMLRELKRAVEGLGLRGLKLHPHLQAIRPTDPRLYPVYAYLEERGLPLVVHTGITGIGAGEPGGYGIELSSAKPSEVDVIASQFPGLTIVMAHFGWPWHEEALAIALHKKNAYLDISGWAPKYLPSVVLQYMRTRLSDKFLFGSDYPMLNHARLLKELRELDLGEGVLSKLLRENALKILPR